MYHFTKVLHTSFERAIAQVTESLKLEGFGILTEIDVQAAFKKKLGSNYRPYKILGACHPGIAYQMLEIDDKAGVLYPCNVVVQERSDGVIEISAIDPLVMFAPLQAPDADKIATEARSKLQRAIESLGQSEPINNHMSAGAGR
jgi:uncharacterized protein (DUF302 family)